MFGDGIPRAHMHLTLSQEARDAYRSIARRLPRADWTREAVAELLDLGLIIEEPSAVSGYLPIDPQRILARWMSRLWRSAGVFARAATDVPKTVRELSQDFHYAYGPIAHGEIRWYEDPADIETVLHEMVDGATRSIVTSVPQGRRSKSKLTKSYERDLAAVRRGVQWQTLHYDGARDDAGTAEWARTMTEAGAEIRTVPQRFPRMVLVDAATAVIPLDLDDGKAGEVPAAIWISDRGVVAHLLRQLRVYWEGAEVWDGVTPRRGLRIDERDAEILDGLRAYDTLKASAKALHMSDRTLSTHVQRLKTALDPSGTQVTTLGQLLYEWGRIQGAQGR
jgi:hypothetical protein